ncbi:hypothetical protein Tco_0580489 [Tanacetum coccineum]
MHIYNLILTFKELKYAVVEYCIPGDLHPRLLPSDLNMNKLPSKYVGLYIEKLEQGGLRVPFSTFFLAVIKHFGVHVSQLVLMGVNRNKTGGRSRKFFKEVTSRLKDWKKKFFLIDHRAMPDAMPWRHTDTDLRDDFPMHYNESDATRLAKFIVPLRPPPRHLLYMCGLTTACRHPELAYNIKYRHGNGKGFQKLLGRRGGFATLSPTPLHHVVPENVKEPATVALIGLTGDATDVEKEVIDLNGNTHASTSPATAIQPSPRLKCAASDAHSFHSSHHEDTEDGPSGLMKRHEQLNHDYVDLCNSSETHLVELDRLRTSRQREMQANDGMTKRLSLLENAHSSCSNRERELVDRLKDMEKEKDD